MKNILFQVEIDIDLVLKHVTLSILRTAMYFEGWEGKRQQD